MPTARGRALLQGGDVPGVVHELQLRTGGIASSGNHHKTVEVCVTDPGPCRVQPRRTFGMGVVLVGLRRGDDQHPGLYEVRGQEVTGATE